MNPEEPLGLVTAGYVASCLGCFRYLSAAVCPRPIRESWLQRPQIPQALDVMPPPLMYQPRPTDPYTLEESASVMETVRAQFETAIAARAEKEAVQAAEVRRRAEEELDGFYDDRTDEVRMAQ